VTRRSGAGTPAQLSARDRDKAMEIYRELPLVRHDVLPLWPRMVRLASNLSVYDASYVALAEALTVPFVTSDARIARGYDALDGTRCRIETL
jgi:predicted nucleic acid-binding protein